MSATRGDARSWSVGAAAVGATVLAILAIGGAGSDRPLDPRSDGRLGTSALVAFVDELGGDVDVGDRLPPPDGGGAAGTTPDVIVLLHDQLGDDRRVELEDWVAAGGTLVVVDPDSLFTPAVTQSFSSLDDVLPPDGTAVRCGVDPLADLDLGELEPRNGGVLYDVPAGADACVADVGGDAYIVASDDGAGTVVALGGAGLVVNAGLAKGENAAVVGALIVPTEGTDVLVLEPGAVAGTGDRSPVDLVSPGVKRGLVQLGVAFAVYVLWRARRLGRPVAEPQPVAVAGSELVAAVGTLLDRSRSPQHAADLLRADLRHWLGDRMGLPPGTSAEVLASATSGRTGVDHDRLVWALGSTPVADDDRLVTLADTIDLVREEVSAHV
ncbi:MAG: DUF4350 domain-containing protein [Acidimicrobiales bacterium]